MSDNILETKICGSCHKEKSHLEYNHYSHKQKQSGLLSICKVCQSLYMKRYRSKNRDKLKTGQRLAQEKKKLIVYNHYSNNDIKCVCCGEGRIEFLSLDHIDNDGYKYREKIGGGGYREWCWLVKNNFPPIIQVMCFNCNMAKAFSGLGVCPHKIK